MGRQVGRQVGRSGTRITLTVVYRHAGRWPQGLEHQTNGTPGMEGWGRVGGRPLLLSTCSLHVHPASMYMYTQSV